MFTKKTTEEFAKDLCEKFNISSDAFELLTPYKGYDKNIALKCTRCGLVKESMAGNFLLKKTKYLCRCYSYSEEWFKERQAFIDWEKKQTAYQLLEEYKGQRVNILVKCNKCGAEQRRSPTSLVKNDGCLICEKKCNQKKTEEQLQKELFDIYGGEYTYIRDYKDALCSALFKHESCGKIYSTKPHYLLTQKGGTCPICRGKSKGEKTIASFLKRRDILFEEQKRLEGLKRCPYDFYLPDYNLLVEYQGIQHFEPIERFGGNPSLIRQKEIDALKKQYAEENNYNFLAISYQEFEQIDSILVQRLSCGEEQRKRNGSHLEKDEDIV